MKQEEMKEKRLSKENEKNQALLQESYQRDKHLGYAGPFGKSTWEEQMDQSRRKLMTINKALH